jgi:hypothetical protein
MLPKGFVRLPWELDVDMSDTNLAATKLLWDVNGNHAPSLCPDLISRSVGSACDLRVVVQCDLTCDLENEGVRPVGILVAMHQLG